MNCVERVKAICKERNIPISKLEGDLKFSNAYIRGLKKGTIPYDKLQKIADYLKLDIDYLATGVEKKAPVFDPEHLELISLYSQLKKEQKEAVFSLLRSFAPNSNE